MWLERRARAWPSGGHGPARKGVLWPLSSPGGTATTCCQARDAENALTLARAAGDRPTVARALHVFGVVAQNEGDYERARTLLEEAAVLHRELGQSSLFAACTHNLGLLAWHQHDLARVHPCWKKGSRCIAQPTRPAQLTRQDPGLLAAVEQRYGDADQLLRESLALARAIAWNEGIVVTSKGPRRWPRRGEPAQAASTHRRRGCARGADRPATGRLRTGDPRRREAAVRGALGDERFSELRNRGAGMELSTSSSDDVQTSFRGGRAS